MSTYEDYFGWTINHQYLPDHQCHEARGRKQYAHDAQSEFLAHGASESEAMQILFEWINLIESAFVEDETREPFDFPLDLDTELP